MQASKITARFVRRALAMGAVSGLALTAGLTAASGATGGAGAPAKAAQTFSFKLVPSSPAIKACLPHASGRATITTGRLNDTMKVSISGMPRGAGFDLFVIQQPLTPFGVSWYQSDVNAGDEGSGSATVKGIFDSETFSVSPGGTVTFPPTHQFHLGLWFNNPKHAVQPGLRAGGHCPHRHAVQR